MTEETGEGKKPSSNSSFAVLTIERVNMGLVVQSQRGKPASPPFSCHRTKFL